MLKPSPLELIERRLDVDFSGAIPVEYAARKIVRTLVEGGYAIIPISDLMSMTQDRWDSESDALFDMHCGNQ